jgi:hypothetical protein
VPKVIDTVPLTEDVLRAFAMAWYEALDRHDDLASVQSHVVPHGLEMVFPETTTSGVDGFGEWYRTVTNKFFDEDHAVRTVDIISIAAEQAEMTVLVNWKASKWDRPSPHSERLDFDAFQRWWVVAGPGGPLIARYVVETFEPNPGSAGL